MSVHSPKNCPQCDAPRVTSASGCKSCGFKPARGSAKLTALAYSRLSTITLNIYLILSAIAAAAAIVRFLFVLSGSIRRGDVQGLIVECLIVTFIMFHFYVQTVIILRIQSLPPVLETESSKG